MDKKEQIEAANALIGWCNTQDISREDALLVMSKVIAKIIVQKEGLSREALLPALDAIHLRITHDINERIVAVARGAAGPTLPTRRPSDGQ